MGKVGKGLVDNSDDGDDDDNFLGQQARRSHRKQEFAFNSFFNAVFLWVF